jgi:hypothetical protein
MKSGNKIIDEKIDEKHKCIKDDGRMQAWPSQGMETRWQAIQKRKHELKKLGVGLTVRFSPSPYTLAGTVAGSRRTEKGYVRHIAKSPLT